MKPFFKPIHRKKVFYSVMGIITLLFIIWSIFFIYHSSFLIDGKRYYSLFDDGMISMKYAWNLAQGNGFVWNTFERVEGYTNPLWVLIMVPFNLLMDKRFAVLAIQVLGIVILLGIVYFSIHIARTTKLVVARHRNLHSYLLALLLLTYYPLLYWTLMGMETGLLTLLIIISIYFMLRYIGSHKLRDGYVMSLFLSLAYLTRPDSLPLALAIMGGSFIFLTSSIRKISLIKKFLGVLAFYFFVVAVHLLFRKYYYGELIPNTVTLKVLGLSTWFRIENGLGFIKPFLWESVLLIAFVGAAVIFHSKKMKLFFFSLFLITCLYQIFVGGDSWNYWRFFVPIMPLLFILASAGIVESVHYLFGKKIFRKIKRESLMWGACFLVVIGVSYVHNNRFIGQMIFRESIFSVEYNAINTNFALRLKEISKPNASVGVIWAGAIPYYSERDGIDFLGKSDKYIAGLKPDLTVFTSVYGMKTLPGHNKYDLKYSILNLQPDVIERADWANQSVYTHPDFNYETIKYKGATLHVRKNSENIYWEKIGK